MSDRIHSIDTLRVVAIGFVLFAHSPAFKSYEQYGNYIRFIFDTIGHFDVPFFFMTSGFFLATKVKQKEDLNKLTSSIKKIASLYLLGILLYLPVIILGIAASTTTGLEPPGAEEVANMTFQQALINRFIKLIDPVDFLYYGDSVAVHLWFLTALIYSFIFIGAFVAKNKQSYILPTAAILHLIGILDSNYPFILEIPIESGGSLFFGFFYVALGYQLQQIDWRPDTNRSYIYLTVAVLMGLIQLTEGYFIGYIIRDAKITQEVATTGYTFSTILFVAAIFIYALAAPNMGKETQISSQGKYVVGVYLIHYPVTRIFEAIGIFSNTIGLNLSSIIWWHLSLVPATYVISLFIYFGLDYIGMVNIGGSHVPRLSRMRDSITQIRETNSELNSD